MKSKALPIMLIALIAASGAILPVTAQTPAYQAEEQAFRARQNEGARLHDTHGANSQQFQQWSHQEKGTVPQSQYYSNNGYRGNNRWNRSNNRSSRYNANRSANWNWDAHNWNDQRSYLKSHWNRHDDRRMSAQQRQQLDNQMRAQWMQYKNNNWRGNTTWNQYNDPGFLDYIHTRNPSLMQTLRTQIGF